MTLGEFLDGKDGLGRPSNDTGKMLVQDIASGRHTHDGGAAEGGRETSV